MIFPEGYSSNEFNIGTNACKQCTNTSNCSAGTTVECDYDSEIRMLTVYNGSAVERTQFIFSVEGASNPDFDRTSDDVEVYTYELEQTNPDIYSVLDRGMTFLFNTEAGAL